MSKKRTSPESSNDEQTIEGLDSVFQQDDNAKRARLTLLCDTELQDLPMELIECILVKAVAMEVEGMKLAKSVWKEKADLVISRLRTVCPQWNYILTTDFFRNELHRTLDRTAQKTIRLEILQQSMLQLHAYKITTLKDEIFIVCISDKYYRYSIHVYDRNNMAEVKDVIPLSGISVNRIAACSVSNCVYLLNSKTCSHISIQRIAKDDEHKFNISTLISDLCMLNPYEFVTSNGSLILSGFQRSERFPVISIYNANGSLQHEIRFSSDIAYFRAIFPKSNGNLILVSQNNQMQARLTEIDRDGSILRQYQSSLCAFGAVCHADIYGRIVIVERPNRFELLDSEFNLLDFTCSQLLKGMVVVPWILHFNSERNEVVTTVENDALTILRFTEE